MNTQRQANDFDFSKKLTQEPIVKERKYAKFMSEAKTVTGKFFNTIFKNIIFQLVGGALIFIVGLITIFSMAQEGKKADIAKEKAKAAIVEKNKIINEKGKADAENKKLMAARNTLIKKISAVPQHEFDKMMVFVKEQVELGQKVAARGLYAGDYMMKNQKKYNYNMEYIFEKKTNIVKYQREHEKFVYSRIVLLGDVYQSVHNKETNDIEFVNLERFITWLGYYRSGEKYINEHLQAQVDHIVAITDITDEINKNYPDALKNN